VIFIRDSKLLLKNLKKKKKKHLLGLQLVVFSQVRLSLAPFLFGGVHIFYDALQFCGH
jgi:hypothetical protein